MKAANRVNSLDLLKGIGCIGVVFIHYTFPGLFGELVHKLAEFAVPVFFMITGYFAYGCDDSVIKKRLIHIFKVFLFSLMLFFLYMLFSHAKSNSIGIWLGELISVRKIIFAVVFCTIEFAEPLWFFIALIETYLLWIIILKFNHINEIEKINYLFFIFGLFVTIVVETGNFDWSYKVNFLGRAWPWFVFGHKMHGTYGGNLIKKRTGVLLAFTIVSALISLLPVLIDTLINFSYFGIIGYSIGVFSLAIKYKSPKHFAFLIYVGRELSLYIYVLHVLIAAGLFLIFRSFFNFANNGFIFDWIWPLTILLASIIVSFSLDCMKKFMESGGRKSVYESKK